MSDNGGNGNLTKISSLGPAVSFKSSSDTNLSAKKKKIFFEILRTTGNATQAARECGFSRRHVYELREKDPAFSAEWDSIKQEYLDWLESKCDERATRDDKPSDLLMMFRLKGERPTKYRDNVNITHRHDHFVNLDIKQLITIAQLGVDEDRNMLCHDAEIINEDIGEIEKDQE